eukprot:scaffold7381_cov310-Pinguiococcus_pyrenoidosus.AAC.72
MSLSLLCLFPRIAVPQANKSKTLLSFSSSSSSLSQADFFFGGSATFAAPFALTFSLSVLRSFFKSVLAGGPPFLPALTKLSCGTP